MREAFELVRLANGAASVRYAAYGEILHPVAGPQAEAEEIYVRQLRLPERGAAARGGFVVWDVGMGIAANALTVACALAGRPIRLRLVSFDDTLAPLRFALEHAGELPHLNDFAGPARELITSGRCEFRRGQLTVEWSYQAGDFPSLLASGAAGDWLKPDAILFDPFSPAANPAMWTLDVFRHLWARLDPDCPCNLATYSRTTFVRVSLLLAGFFVGAGAAVPGKEETTVAANDPALIACPLDGRWLERARRSHSAEPLREAVYRQAPLAPETWQRLRAHPQFA